MWAGMQVMVLALLARGLTPVTFAHVSIVMVALQVVVMTNGFGLQRQIQLKRSEDARSPELPGLYALRLRFTYVSAIGWLVGCVVLSFTQHSRFPVEIAPLSLWLVSEQCTTIWNGINIVDNRSRELFASYAARRLPPTVMLIPALILDWNMVLTWSLSLTFGSTLAYLVTMNRQESWARLLWPFRRNSVIAHGVTLDVGYWFCLVGMELRDLDVAAVSAVSASAGGVYALPARLVRPMNLITQAAGAVAFPRLVRRSVISRKHLMLGTLVGISPATLIAACVYVLAPVLPRVIGSEYRASIGALRILCFAAVMTAGITLFSTFLQARSSRATTHAGVLVLAFAFAQIMFASVGATINGGNGAAAGACLTQAVLLVLLLVRSLSECSVPQVSGSHDRRRRAPAHRA